MIEGGELEDDAGGKECQSCSDHTIVFDSGSESGLGFEHESVSEHSSGSGSAETAIGKRKRRIPLKLIRSCSAATFTANAKRIRRPTCPQVKEEESLYFSIERLIQFRLRNDGVPTWTVK